MKSTTLLALAALTAGVTAGLADSPYAVSVVSVIPGPNADFGVEDNMLGPPQGGGHGGGSLDVYGLGQGGQVVLELDTPLFDGPGADLLVCENPFVVTGSDWDCFVELLTVEVSTDGDDWVRFPTDFDGPPGPYLQGSFQLGTDLTDFDGFAGVLPVFADPPAFEALNVVEAGGDAFDLAVLADDPLVQNGFVDLDELRYVRLTDVQAGVDLDDDGDVIWDCGNPAFAAAEVDAVVGLNRWGASPSGRPEVELDLDPTSGLLTLTVADTDGLYQIKNGLRASINGLELPFASLLPFFVLLSIDGFEATFVTGPVPPGFERTLLKVAATDLAGLHGGDSLLIK